MEYIIEAYLNANTAGAKVLSGFICDSESANYVFAAVSVLIRGEHKLESDIDKLELTYSASELVKECRISLLESNRAVIAHLEKFQCQGYHFENLIHALKLENESLSEEIRLA